MKLLLRLIVALCRSPALFIAALRRLDDRIHKAIEEFVEDLPDTLDAFNEGFGGGRYQSEEHRLEKLLKSFVRRDKLLYGKLCHYTARNMIGLADFYRGQYRYGDAEKWYLSALEAMEHDLPPNDAKRIAAYTRVADFLVAYGKQQEAEILLQKAVLGRRAQGAEFQSNLADDLHALGCVQAALNKKGAAVEAFSAEMHMRELASPPTSADHMSLIDEIAKLHRVLGNHREAARFEERADLLVEVSVMHKALGDDHYALSKPMMRLAAMHEHESNFTKGAYFRDWVALVQLVPKVKGGDYPALPEDLDCLGALYERRNLPGDLTMAHRARFRAANIRKLRKELAEDRKRSDSR